MSKSIVSIVFILLMSFFLTACGSNSSSWDNEAVVEDDHSHPILSDDVKAVWTVDEGQSSSTDGSKSIRLVLEKKDGGAIEAFDVNHEKLLHLIVISKDLSYFNHIHPEYKGGGVFEIENTFPAGGDYRLIADFKPTGGEAMSVMEWVRVEGKTAQPVPVTPDTNLDKVANGTRVTLSIDKLAAKEELTLKFSLSDEKTGQPITDLEPYLGSIGHVVVLKEDGEKYLHVHAGDGQGAGPDALFDTEFPQSGVYKIWGQFQRNHEVITVSYVVNVQ